MWLSPNIKKVWLSPKWWGRPSQNYECGFRRNLKYELCFHWVSSVCRTALGSHRALPSTTRIASLAESRLYTWNCFSFRSAVRRYENRFSPTTRTNSVFHRVRVLSSHRVRVTSVCRTVLGSHRALPSTTRVESLPESRLYTWNCFGFRGYLFFFWTVYGPKTYLPKCRFIMVCRYPRYPKLGGGR